MADGTASARPFPVTFLTMKGDMVEPRKRILVVDDSEDLREFYRLVLEQAGYEVLMASSGEEALGKVKTLRPDLILLDLIMPEMDGFELLTRLRSDFAPPIPPVVLCSGFDLTEEEALRRGALMFVRKPVAAEDLAAFVAHGLRGERSSPEMAAREHANSTAARMTARRTATTFVDKIRAELNQRAAGQMEWLAAYFGVETALMALMDDGRLTVFAVAGDPSITVGLELSRRLPPCYEILESRSSLVLADASIHACFSTGPYRLEGARFFAGVPLIEPEGVPIGVVCLIDSHPRRTQAEDLVILEQVGRQGSRLFQMLASGRPQGELPGRHGAGMMLRPSFEVLVDAELRMLRRSGGSMELAIVEIDDPQRMREAVLRARSRHRLGAGVLGLTRVGVYKRDSDGGAAAELRTLLSGLEASNPLGAVSTAWIGGTGLPPLGGQDLLRLAELGMEQAQDGRGWQRLVLQHEVQRP